MGRQDSRRGASRAVGDGGSARGHSDELGAVDGGLGIATAVEGSHRRGDEAGSKHHGTHLDGLVGWSDRLVGWRGGKDRTESSRLCEV